MTYDDWTPEQKNNTRIDTLSTEEHKMKVQLKHSLDSSIYNHDLTLSYNGEIRKSIKKVVLLDRKVAL